jgi:hypothetical protein
MKISRFTDGQITAILKQNEAGGGCHNSTQKGQDIVVALRGLKKMNLSG